MKTIFVAFFLIFLWQLAVWLSHVPDYFLPSPLQVLAMIQQQKWLLLSSAWITLLEAILGFILALVFGGMTALLFFHYRPLSHLFWPTLLISQALPTLAIAPLLVLWLGYGLTSKIMLVVILLFFPITSAFLDGLQRTDPLWLAMSRLMTHRSKAILWYIQIPAALPHLASGIRIAAAGALMGAVIGEWVGASKGLGFLLLEANARFQTALVFATMIVLVILSLAFFKCIDWLLKSLITW